MTILSLDNISFNPLQVDSFMAVSISSLLSTLNLPVVNQSMAFSTSTHPNPWLFLLPRPLSTAICRRGAGPDRINLPEQPFIIVFLYFIIESFGCLSGSSFTFPSGLCFMKCLIFSEDFPLFHQSLLSRLSSRCISCHQA